MATTVAELKEKYRPFLLLERQGNVETFAALMFVPCVPDWHPVLALRRYRRELGDGALRAVREALKTALAVSHGAIEQVHDVWSDGGDMFSAGELVYGQRYDQVILRAGGAPAYAPLHAHVVRGLLDGLHCLHTSARDRYGAPAGFVHGRLDATSAIVGYEGGAKIVDLVMAGIAPCGGRGASIYRDAPPPQPMTPEWRWGLPPDRRTDVFLAGALLWSALSATPFHWAPAPAGAAPNRAPPSLAEACPWAPPPLVAAVDRALCPRPEGRYADAAEMRDALSRYLRSLPGPIGDEWAAARMNDLFGEERRALDALFVERMGALIEGREAPL